MKSEILAVVDQHDKVIDKRPRYEIHQQGLRHRAVHVLVFNVRKELLLQKRSMRKDLNKGLWDTSAAGHVDVGESYLAGAIRESREELGVDVGECLHPLFKLSPSKALGMEFVQVYRCTHNGPFVPCVDEIDELCWSSLDRIQLRVENNDITLTETFKMIWRQFNALPDQP